VAVAAPFDEADVTASLLETTDRLRQLARAPALALLLDLDGTLVPFADTPTEAVIDAELEGLLGRLGRVGILVVVVSGRSRPDLEAARASIPGAWWVAEHGAHRLAGERWEYVGDEHPELEEIHERLRALSAGVIGVRIERKAAAVCLHWRRVPVEDRAELIDVAEHAIDDWLDGHPGHERLAGADLVEVRVCDHHKGTAVAWVRGLLPEVRMIAVGDDVTDEDMFRALDAEDVAVVVGRPGDRVSSAQYAVDDVRGVRQLLRWLVEAREGLGSAAPPVHVLAAFDAAPRTSLLVISNRTPSSIVPGRPREVGGLVTALEPALHERAGTWLGWSGQQREGVVTLRVERDGVPTRASFDFSAKQRRLFYGGFCNRSLWPLLHGLPGRVRFDDAEWREYLATNELYARLASELVEPTGTVWVHDYHLFLVPGMLRRRGHTGPIGFFLHVPFPPREVFQTLPWAREVLEGVLGSDLIGFHTAGFVANFVDACGAGHAVAHGAHVIEHPHGRSTVGAFPIAIDAPAFHTAAERPPAADVEGLRAMLSSRKLLLGVDRLDYSKGIPERLEAFERLLENVPRWRGRVSFVQISVPSRAEVPEYAELRDRVEHLVGRINGRFGEAHWVPVRYLYRSYGHEILAQLYRLADVAVVTPLRDGMNLIAKEFVAAQDPVQPGVLVLSRFAGAAEELTSAILTNPFHVDGLAADLDHALSMPIDERRDRHARLYAAVSSTSPTGWARSFLDALSGAILR
jgi:alpha,alpha-trehalose-phosphate synthase [UDP-forming]/trehalose-phosphatase